MVTEELMMIERIGIGAAAFFLVYLLLKKMIHRSFEQADMILNLAKDTIQRNTEALEHMQDSLIAHMKQKDLLIKIMEDCKKTRDKQMQELLEIKKKHL